MHSARHLGIVFLILVENMQVRQMSSHSAEMAAVEFLFKETMNDEPWNSVSGSETQASLTSLAHATSDYSCRAILLQQHGFVYQLSAKEGLGVPSGKNPENHH